MRYLLDTGILLRLVHRADSSHEHVRAAVRELRRQQHSFVTATQNIAEFWNVCTRPSSARGGLGLTIAETSYRLRTLERGLDVLADGPGAYGEWKRIVANYAVMGVKVHDARVVALMATSGVRHLLTLNSKDFARYAEVMAVSPEDVVPAPPPASQPP